MKRKALALATLGCVASGGAAAQSSVTLYGLVDSGIEYVSHAGPTGSSVVKMTSGGKNTSRWGLRGTEDLGGGLKAIFTLESGIALDTGKLDTDNTLFDRRAWVGLQDKTLGSIRMGRDFTTTYDFMLPFDPMGYAPNYSWATSATATGGRKDGMFSAPPTCCATTASSVRSRWAARWRWAKCRAASRARPSTTWAWAMNAGKFAAALTWDRQNGAGTSTTPADSVDYIQGIHAGASYDFGSLSVYAGYRNYRKTFTTSAAKQLSDMYWLGAAYDFTPAFTLYGAIYKQNIKGDTDADPILFSLRAQYNLSKRTMAYLSAGYAKARNGQNVSVSRDNIGYANNQVGVTAGLQHRF
jgi:predicted porin